MIVFEALMTALTFVWFAYSVWRHRHEPVWQIGTLALLGYAYYLVVPGWLRDFTVVS